MNIFVDIGNTNIKVNFKINNKEHFFNYKTKLDYTIDTFFPLLPDVIKEAKISKVFVCSVVPFKHHIIKHVFKKYFDVEPIDIAYPLKTGLQIKSNNAQNVGADLIAIGAFLNSQSQEKSVMVNMGTATTIVVANNGSFEGAIIAPGLKKSFESLIGNAAKLNQISLKITAKKIGRTTEDAISIGVLNGQAEMIKGLVEKIKAKNLFISGGLAYKVIELLPEFKFIKEATICGMKKIAELNYHEKF